jgi:hypothetical protein
MSWLFWTLLRWLWNAIVTLLGMVVLHWLIFKKVSFKMAETAVLEYLDDRVAEALGISAPSLGQIVDFGWQWLAPLLIAIALMWSYHLFYSGNWKKPEGRRKLLGLALCLISAIVFLAGLGLLAAPSKEATRSDGLPKDHAAKSAIPSPPTTTVPSIPPAISNATPPAAITSSPRANTNYTAYEKEKLSIAMQELSDLLNKKGITTIKLTDDFIRGLHPIMGGSFKIDKETLLQKLGEISSGAEQLYTTIYKQMIPGNFYAEELTALVGVPETPVEQNPIYILNQTAGTYAGEVRTLAELLKNDDLQGKISVLNGRNIMLSQAKNNFQSWVLETNARITQKKRELREAK